MKNMFLKFLSFVLSIAVIFAPVSLNSNNSLLFSAAAAEETEASTTKPACSGAFGDELTWIFGDRTLTISGTGDIDAFDAPPWNLYINEIQTINISYGITSIGASVFESVSNLIVVNIADSVLSIGKGAFKNCGSMLKVTVPNSVTFIEDSAFDNCPNLTVYGAKGSYSDAFCVSNSINYYFTDMAVCYPMPYSVEYNGNRYGRFDVSCSWYEAKRVCEMLGGHLAVVTSEEELNAVSTLLSGATKDTYWLGATDVATDGTWEWVTGEAFSYSNWMTGEPNGNTNENCLEMYYENSCWNDNNGYNTELNNGFICEYEQFFIPYHTVTYNGHIYSLFNENLTWIQAKKACELMGGHLVTISDSQEQAVVQQLFDGPHKFTYWIGLYDHNLDGTWEWVTGESADYLNWNTGEPNEPTDTAPAYGQIYAHNSGGNKVGCWNDLYNEGVGVDAYRLANIGFICEVDTESYKPVVRKYYGNNLYEVYDTNINWNDSRTFALLKGGHLAVISDETENDFIMDLCNSESLTNNEFWLGAACSRYNRDFIWCNGEKFDYTSWSAGEPNNWAGLETFLQYNKTTGGWNDSINYYDDYLRCGFVVEYENHKETISLYDAESNLIDKYEVQGGVITDKPSYSVMGYTIEWYKDEELSQSFDFENEIITSSTTLYAKCIKNVYDVSFDGNGSDDQISSKEVEFDSVYGDLPVVQKVGYDFAGWFTAEGLQIDESSIVKIADNHVLYAKWIESEVDSLSVSQLPLKTEYSCSDSFSAEGLEIIVSFDNGSKKTISYEDVEFSNVDLSRPGKKLIKAYYGGKYTTFFITVKEKDITAIEITTLPNKTTYTVGDDFDATGMELTASYDDSSTKTITSGYTISCNTKSVGTEIVTVSYTENGITVATDFTITVNEKQSDGKPTITASSVTVQAGNIVSIPFTVEQNTGFMGFVLEVSYDDTVMVPLKVSAGEILSSGNLDDSIGGTVESGKLKVIFFASENVTADGILFTVEFEVFDDAVNQQSKVEIKAIEEECFNEDWNTVSFNTSPFEIQIISSAETVPYIAFADAFADESNKIILPLKLENMLGVTEFKFELMCDKDVLLPDAVVCSGLPDSNVELTQSGKKYYLKWSGTRIVQDEVVLNIYFKASEHASGETDVIVACCIPEQIDSISTVISINKLLPQTTRLETDLAITSAGDTVKIPLYIKHNNGILGFGLTVEYDESVLTPISVSRGEILTNGLIDNNISTESGSFKIVWNNSEELTKDGELLVIEFAVASNIDVYASDILLSYSQQDTFNEAWQDVELEIENTAVLIDPISVVSQSGAVENNGYIYGLKAGLESLDGYFETVSEEITLCVIASDLRIGSGSVVRVQYKGNTADAYKTILFGDVNGDGWYDAEDAFLVNLIVAGLLTEDKLPAYMWKAADCNHDGLINEIDVDLLMGAGVRKNDIDQNVAQSELVIQAAYIEYVSLIDQSAYLNSDFTPDTDNSEQVTNPEKNETIKLDALVEETDVEAIFANIFEFIKKILSFIFSFII